MRERYAADPSLTVEAIARETGRAQKTVRWHSEKQRWGAHRREVQAKTAERTRESLEKDIEAFSLTRARKLMRMADLHLDQLIAKLESGKAEVDAFRVQAALKSLDESHLAGKIAQQITPILFEAMDRSAIEQLIAERRASSKPQPPPAPASNHATNGTTASTPTPHSAGARVASLFSRRNGTS